MIENLIPEAPCPACGYVMDRATAIFEEGAVPAAGDLTVCIRCGAALEFGPGLELLPTDVTKLPLEMYEQVLSVRTAIFHSQYLAKKLNPPAA